MSKNEFQGLMPRPFDEKALKECDEFASLGFEKIAKEQADFLADFWKAFVPPIVFYNRKIADKCLAISSQMCNFAS